MKRYFCTICQKIKYAREFPRGIQNPSSLDPTKRIGQCEFHAYDLPKEKREPCQRPS